MSDSPTPLEEKRRHRLELINAVYEATDGSRSDQVNVWELGEQTLGWDRAITGPTADYLVDEGLLEYTAMGGEIALTHQGVVEVEDSLANPEDPTIHFPASVNIINVGHMTDSTIQQGSPGASVENWTVSDNLRADIEGLLHQLREDLGTEIQLVGDDLAELEAEVETVLQQVRSPRPKRHYLGESLSRIKELLTNAATASGATMKLAEHADKIAAVLGSL